MSSELIISTYENPRALSLCLESLRHQTRMCDGICIADDGSGPETAQVIARYARENPQVPLRHVWHPDRGFEKCAILNKAIASSQAEFLVFLDGDVLLHPRFIARHFELARPGRFTSGGIIRLDAQASASVTAEAIAGGRIFDRAWLRANRAIDRLGTWLKTMPFGPQVMGWFDRLTPVPKSLLGANWSGFRADILKVNGFDETIKYGGLDKEMGYRLMNAGVAGQHMRYTAPLLHLDHPRGYRDPDRVRRQKAALQATRRSGRFWTENGIARKDH